MIELKKFEIEIFGKTFTYWKDGNTEYIYCQDWPDKCYKCSFGSIDGYDNAYCLIDKDHIKQQMEKFVEKRLEVKNRFGKKINE